MGEAVAKNLAQKGWQIAILDMNEKSGQAVADSLKGIFIKTDVTSQESQTAAFVKVWETYGQIDFGEYIQTKPKVSQHDDILIRPRSIRQCGNRGEKDFLCAGS